MLVLQSSMSLSPKEVLDVILLRQGTTLEEN